MNTTKIPVNYLDVNENKENLSNSYDSEEIDDRLVLINSFIPFNELIDGLYYYVTNADDLEINERDFVKIYNIMNKMFKRVYNKILIEIDAADEVSDISDLMKCVDSFSKDLRKIEDNIRTIHNRHSGFKSGSNNVNFNSKPASKNEANSASNNTPTTNHSETHNYEYIDNTFMENIKKKFLSNLI